MTDMPKPPEWVVSRKARINKRLTVEMMMGSAGRIYCEWSPDVPKQLTPPEWKRYRRARDEMIAEFSRRTGIDTLVVEVEL